MPPPSSGIPPPGAAFGLRRGHLGDDGLGAEEQGRDGGGVLQRGADHLRRVDHAGLDQVLVDVRLCVVAMVALQLPDPRHDHGAFVPGVARDLAQRLLQRAPDDADSDRLVALGLHGRHGAQAAQERDAAAGDDALLDRGLGRVHRVLDPRLLLLHLGLGRGPDLDHRHAAHELRQPLLELLAVVVGRRLVDLGAQLLDPALDVLGLARPLDDRGVVLVDRDLLGLAEVVDLEVLELDAEVLGDRLAAGQDRDVLEHGLAAVAVARGLHRRHVQRPAQLVHDEGGQGLALQVLGDDQQRLAELGHLLEQRQQVLHPRDLLLVDQHERVLEHALHPLGVGHEVRREVAAVELHALDDLERGLDRLRLLDRDDAVLADLLHRLRDDAADRLVVVRRDRPDLRDHLALHGLAELLELLGDRGHRLLDAALEGHRVGARR